MYVQNATGSLQWRDEVIENGARDKKGLASGLTRQAMKKDRYILLRGTLQIRKVGQMLKIG